jgi:hypothetical protein
MWDSGAIHLMTDLLLGIGTGDLDFGVHIGYIDRCSDILDFGRLLLYIFDLWIIS